MQNTNEEIVRNLSVQSIHSSFFSIELFINTKPKISTLFLAARVS
jgi:hypothetical protein